MKFKIISIIFLILSFTFLNAVDGEKSQSPSVENFVKVGEPPSANYTGDLIKAFPLMKIKGRELEFDLTLRYQSGISPWQEASWVGLGFSLNWPSITRSIRGVPDDWDRTEVGYVPGTSNTAYMTGYLKSDPDDHPNYPDMYDWADEWHLTLPNYSSRIFPELQSIINNEPKFEFKTENWKAMKIEYSYDQASNMIQDITVYDLDGTRYVFENGLGYNNITGQNHDALNNLYSWDIRWDISYILTSDYKDDDGVSGPSDGDTGDWLKFIYTNPMTIDYRYNRFSVEQIDFGDNPKSSNQHFSLPTEVSWLTQIESSNEKILFNLSDSYSGAEHSIPGQTSNNYPKKIDNIILSKNESRVKKIVFNYAANTLNASNNWQAGDVLHYVKEPDHYYNEKINSWKFGGDGGKLTLLNIQEYGISDSNFKPPLEFSYDYNRGNLTRNNDDMFTEHLDNFRESYLITGIADVGVDFQLDKRYYYHYWSDSDYNPDMTGEYIKYPATWSLKSIKYPLGMIEEFEYESDEYTWSSTVLDEKDINEGRTKTVAYLSSVKYGGGIRVSRILMKENEDDLIADEYTFTYGDGVRSRGQYPTRFLKHIVGNVNMLDEESVGQLTDVLEEVGYRYVSIEYPDGSKIKTYYISGIDKEINGAPVGSNVIDDEIGADKYVSDDVNNIKYIYRNRHKRGKPFKKVFLAPGATSESNYYKKIDIEYEVVEHFEFNAYYNYYLSNSAFVLPVNEMATRGAFQKVAETITIDGIEISNEYTYNTINGLVETVIEKGSEKERKNTFPIMFTIQMKHLFTLNPKMF